MPELNQRPAVEVLGIPLFAGDIPLAIETVVAHCISESRNNYCISATGAHGLVFSKKNRPFAQVLEKFYLNLPDGMPAVWVGRMKGAKHMKRCYGPNFFEQVMRSTKDLQISHFFCGGNEGVANELKDAVENKFGNRNIVGTFCPPYLAVGEYDYDMIAEVINQTDANIVWIGLSTPKQELFASNLAQKTKVNFIVTVGAAFDFHTDRVKQAPSIMQKIGLEWFFRLLMEPRRLFKRYLEIVPLFIYFNIKEFMGRKFAR